MSIIPPSNFWDSYSNIRLTGISTGADPLYVTGTTMHVKDASIVDSGVVTTGTQTFLGAKQFNTSVALADAYAVHATSNDTTLVGDSATSLVTEHATKTYVDNSVGGAVPVMNPYSVITADGVGHLTSSTRYVIDNSDANASKFKIYSPDGTKLMQVAVDQLWNVGQLYSTAAIVELWGNAGKAMSMSGTDIHGYLTTNSTSPTTGAMINDGGLGVAKDAYVGGLVSAGTGVSIDSTGTGYLNTTGTGIGLILHTGTAPANIANTSTIYFNPPAGGKHLDIHASTGSNLRIYQGATLQSAAFGPTAVETYLHTAVISTTAFQFSIAYNLLNYVNFDVSAGGDLTMNATGNDINFHSTDTVHVLNTTASTSKTTGALQVSGGAGISGDVYCDQLNCMSTTVPQLMAMYDLTNYAHLTVDATGMLTITSSGGTISTDTGSVVRILNVADATDLVTGSINTLGGLSVTKQVQVGTGVTAGGTIKAAQLYGSSATNAIQLYITDTGPATGNASMSIITGGHTNLATSGTLYNNSNPVVSSTTTSMLIAWTGAFTGTSNMYFTKHDGVVYGRFEGVYDTATSTAPMNSTNQIPVGYRPVATTNQCMIVYYADPMGPMNQTQVGICNIDTAGNINIWGSQDINQINFPSTFQSGFISFTMTWLVA